MISNLKTTSAPISKRLIAMSLDLLSVIITSVIIYFVGLFAFCNTMTSYPTNNEFINSTDELLNLNLGNNLPYQDYEIVLKHFYLDLYDEEVKQLYSTRYDKKMSIEHVYNVTVLDLPMDPSVELHSNDYFTYVQDPNTGAYDVNRVGIVLPGEHTERFYEDVSVILGGKYKTLKNLLVSVDKDYEKATDENLKITAITRLISGLLAILVFYLIIPFTNKYGNTLCESHYGFAHVNSKNGYRVKWYKKVLRPILSFIVPLFFITSGVTFQSITLAIVPIFINYLCLIFNKSNHTLTEMILGMETASEGDSLIFENEEDESSYENSDEYKQVEDQDYLDKLSSFGSIKISESRDEEVKKDINKKTDSDKEE